MNPLDTQVGGDHYKNKAIQPIEYIMANEMDFCEGNVVKYITRWKDKGGVESLRKIKQYVDFLIERELKNGKEKA
jgi:hypothetical protein